MSATRIQIPALGLLAMLSTTAFAQTAPFVGSGIDPNTFIVGHPASPTWTHPHANREHPAVLVAARAKLQVGGIDSNTFIVQPPASVRWLAASEDTPVKVAAAR